MPWKPTARDWTEVVQDQNPWSTIGTIPAELAPPVRRALARLLPGLTKETPQRFHLVLGPRRVGKTTAMYQAVQQLLSDGISPQRLWWFRLDHPVLLQYQLGAIVKWLI